MFLAFSFAMLQLTAAQNEVTTNLTDLSFEELMEIKTSTVYAASKREQQISEAPALVTIVTSQDVKQFGYRTLTEILNSVGGFYSRSDRNYNYLGVRGVSRPEDFGGRILITVNGHRLNDPVYDQAFNGQDFPVDVDLIDRVEVIRGPGSSLYGNNAAFAVVNVITRRGRDVDGVEASAAIASFDTYSGRLSYGKRFTNGVEMLVSGTLFDSDGHDRLYYPEFNSINNGYAENLDGEYAQKAFLSVSYKDFSLQGAYGSRRKDIPTAPFEGAVFNQDPNYTLDDRAFAELKYARELLHDWMITASLSYDYYHYKAKGPYYSGDPVDPDAFVIATDYNRANSWAGGLQVSKTLFDHHQLTAGAEFRRDAEIVLKGYNSDPYYVYGDDVSEGGNAGLFLQDEFLIRTNLTLNAGLRYDYFASFGGTVSPRVGLLYDPWSMTTFKALYGQAYRAPNAYEFDYNGDGFLANHDLEPERIRSAELIWEQGLPGHLRLSSSVFYNWLDDLITQMPVSETDDNLIFRNTDAIDVYGTEIGLAGHWKGGLRGRLTYTLAQTHEDATGDRIANSPLHLAKLNVAIPLYLDRVSAGVEILGMSPRKTLTGGEVDGHILVNLTLFSQKIVKNLEVSFSVFNLLATHYADPPGIDNVQAEIEQDGRTFRGKLTYRF